MFHDLLDPGGREQFVEVAVDLVLSRTLELIEGEHEQQVVEDVDVLEQFRLRLLDLLDLAVRLLLSQLVAHQRDTFQ